MTALLDYWLVWGAKPLGCSAAGLHGCMVAWMVACMVALLHGCMVTMSKNHAELWKNHGKSWKIMAIIIMAFVGHFMVKLYFNNIFNGLIDFSASFGSNKIPISLFKGPETPNFMIS